MGRYLQPGHTYVDGQTINAASLNEHVGESLLKPTTISEQILKDPAALTDELLINDGGILKKITLQVVQTLVRAGFTVIPVGTVLDFSGDDAPEGFLLCSGQEVSRETYAALFAVVGTTYGAGNGTSSFLLPDLRGRVAAGKDDMGGTSANRVDNSGLVGHGINGDTLGAAGGNDAHMLTTAELAFHGHAASSSTSTLAPMYAVASEAGGNTWNLVRTGSTVPAGGLGFAQRAYITAGFATGCASTTSTSIGGAGSNAVHNNLPPTIILNKIIKT